MDLGNGVQASPAKRGEITETFKVFGVHSVATNHCRTLALPMVHKASGTKYQLELRAYDDGFAWRYRIPGTGARTVNRETSSWTLPSASRVWYAERNNGWKLKSYAGEWSVADIDAMPKVSSQGPVQGPPLVAELRKGLFAVLTEAFFERPRELRGRHPELYQQMSQFFRQDPAEIRCGAEAA